MLDTKLQKLVDRKSPEQIASLAETIAERILLKAQEKKAELEQHLFLDLENVLGLSGISTVKNHLTHSRRKAAEPLKVAMIGDFSSGKTTSLMALVNHRGIHFLPKDLNRPTTGNICEVHLHYGIEDPTFPMTEIYLFSIDQLQQMLDDYLSALCMNDYVKPKLTGFKGNLFSQLDQLVEACRHLLEDENPAIKGMVEDRNNLIEFFRVTRSIQQFQGRYGAFTDNVRVLQIPKNHVNHETLLKKLLQLKPEDKNSSLPFSSIKASIDALWAKMPIDWSNLEEGFKEGSITEESIESLFLLINRIKIHICLPGEGLNNSNKICYLDFPGVGSGGFRDKWLCRRELAAAHASLLFLKADRLASTTLPHLREIIVSEKKELASERILPVLNFFDEYAPLPNLPSEDEEPMSAEQKLERIRHFFKKNNIGFADVLSMFHDLQLTLKPGENYYLLTAVAGLKEEWCNKKERGIIANFWENIAPSYRRLHNALEEVLRQRGKLGIFPEEVTAFKKLYDALDGYLQSETIDGGVRFLREVLNDTLRNKGLKMICEDAVQELLKAIAPLEAELIEPLRESLQSESKDIESVNRIKKREEIRKKWSGISEVASELIKPQKIFDLQLKKEKSKDALNSSEWVSLLEEIRPYCLDKVSQLNFWKKASSTSGNESVIYLNDLNLAYQDLLDEVDQWLISKVQDSLQQTLEFLEIAPIVKEDEEISLSKIKTYFNDLQKHSDQVLIEDEKKMLERFLNLQGFGEELLEKIKIEFQKSLHLFNRIAPFNAKGAILGTSIEIMKLQRQMFKTLQFRLSESVLIMTEIFSLHFKNTLKNRFHQGEDYHPVAMPEALLDKLADLLPEDPALKSNYMMKKQTIDLAVEIVSLWDECLRNI